MQDRGLFERGVESAHMQISYDQYQRDQLFEAARRSRACAYLADDDYGPLALQAILLAGCPTVGVRTGASFVRTGETGVLVDRLPPGRQCVETDDDERALWDYLQAIEHAHGMDRPEIRSHASRTFDATFITDELVVALANARKESLSGTNSDTCVNRRVDTRFCTDQADMLSPPI